MSTDSFNSKLDVKEVLDACCGGRMFWFDKHDERAMFIDNREVDPLTVGVGRNQREYSCKPDLVMDFRDMEFDDEVFSLVVFDPPHFLRAGPRSYMAMKYGKLDPLTWKDDLRAGFSECFRVLKPNGVLVFKWNESHIPIKEILELTPERPLFGHRSGKASKTHWIVFIKQRAILDGSDKR